MSESLEPRAALVSTEDKRTFMAILDLDKDTMETETFTDTLIQ